MTSEVIYVGLDESKQSILTALADKETRQILNLTSNMMKSASDIASEAKIPRSTAYRKINWLVNERLLEVAKITITDDGKKTIFFQSTLGTVIIKYEPQPITIEAINSTPKGYQSFCS